MSWTNYVFFWKKGTRRHIDQNSYFVHIYAYIHLYIHTCMYKINCFFCSWKVTKLWHCARSKFDPGSWTSRHCLFFQPVTKLHNAAQKLKGCQKLSGSVTRLRVIWDHHNCQATTHPEAILCNTRKQRGAFKQNNCQYQSLIFHPGWILIAIAKICWKFEIFQLKIQSIAWS